MFVGYYLSFLILFLASCSWEPQELAGTNGDAIEKAPSYEDDLVGPVVEEPIVPPIGGPLGGNGKTGNPDSENSVCPLTNPDSDNDGVCDNADRCPGFDDGFDEDKDGSPFGCDCNDLDPAVVPGLPCDAGSTLGECFSNICDPDLSGECIVTPDPEGRVCGGALLGPCDAVNTCNATGECIDNKKDVNTVCRKKAGECDIAETCDSINNDCPTNVFTDSGSVCGINDAGSCDGSGHCDRAHLCPGSTNNIDQDGDNWLQECDCDDTNPNIYPGQPCVIGQICSESICDPDLSGECLTIDFDAGRACGIPPSGDCDAQDTCNGTGSCIENVEPSTSICRPAAHQCDAAEFCDGTSTTCPSDSFAPSGTICGEANAGICDRTDTCNGLSVCIRNYAPSTFVCRPKADECDVAETCTGTSATCPSNSFASIGTFCGAPPSGACDVQDTCDALGECESNVEPAGTTCRASSGTCDIEEDCDGISPQCPADSFAPNGETNISCSDTGFEGSCSIGDIICQNGAEICYPQEISCTEFRIFGGPNDLLGQSVAVDNGESILGAYGTHSDAFLNSDNEGSSYLPVLTTPPNTWSRGQQIFPVGQDDEITRGEFGRAVAISGANAIVGAPRTDDVDFGINTQATGRVYFFRKNGSDVWSFLSSFDDPEANGIKTSGAFFGTSVDMSGRWAVAGGPGIRSQLNNLFQGAAELFFLDPDSNSWDARQVLRPEQTIFNAVNGFGTAVAIDGDWMAITAPGGTFSIQPPENGVGSVSFYFNDPVAGWTFVQAISGTVNTEVGFFGSDADISGDLAIVGDPLAQAANGNPAFPEGAASIYRLNPMTNTWDLEQKITNPNAGNTPGYICNFAVAVAIHKNIAVIGADNFCGPADANGAVYIYEYNGSSWQLKETLTDPTAQSGSLITGPQYGASVAIDDNTIVVGSPNAETDNDNGTSYFYYYPQ